ncbi:hypothetical protein BFL36_13050 [Clavibacter michiganensis]|uniref:Uncharacterized protein n=1 Tax=Clavibacter michiganensis TaxID=28447 RepID=A0A251Y3W4_9MICO|nr:hypothetical protein [Clavibacter michiganensis]OUE18964.1 hypothetical protein BFL36_13050 [Clavibacter michiganensis]
MRRAVRPTGLPLAVGVVAVGSACVAAGVLGVLAVGVIRFQRLLLADPVAPPPDAALP